MHVSHRSNDIKSSVIAFINIKNEQEPEQVQSKLITKATYSILIKFKSLILFYCFSDKIF